MQKDNTRSFECSSCLWFASVASIPCRPPALFALKTEVYIYIGQETTMHFLVAQVLLK